MKTEHLKQLIKECIREVLTENDAERLINYINNDHDGYHAELTDDGKIKITYQVSTDGKVSNESEIVNPDIQSVRNALGY